MMSNDDELTRNTVVKNYVVANDVTNSCYGCKTYISNHAEHLSRFRHSLYL